MSRPPSPTPWRTLAIGVAVGVCTIAGIGAYTYSEVRRLRDEQTAISDRNRKDSLQLLRIQNDLASLAVLMRDMLDRTEPYPLPGWQPALLAFQNWMVGTYNVALLVSCCRILNTLRS